jgi:hypothetical protein
LVTEGGVNLEELIQEPSSTRLAQISNKWQKLERHSVEHLDSHWVEEGDRHSHRIEFGLKLTAPKTVFTICQHSKILQVRIGGIFSFGQEEGLFEEWSDDAEREYNDILKQIRIKLSKDGFRRYKRRFCQEYDNFLRCLSTVMDIEDIAEAYNYDE